VEDRIEGRDDLFAHEPDDKPHDQCGVFGVYGHPEAA